MPELLGDRIALEGRIALRAIGGGVIEPGEIDWGVRSVAPPVAAGNM